MKTSSLENIPYLCEDEKDREFMWLYGHRYLAKPQRTEVDGEKLLILNIYERKTVEEKQYVTLILRVFQGKKEFLTEIPGEKRWSRRRLRQLMRNYYDMPKIVMRQKQEEKMVKGFLGATKINKRGIDLFYERQAAIKEQESIQNQQKKIKKSKQLFAKVKPFTDTFVRWLDDRALYYSQYIFYDYTRKKHVPCICSHCKQEFELDRSIPRHNKEGICPICKRPAVFIAKGRLRSRILQDDGEAVKIERIENGLLLRHVMLYRMYRIDKPETWTVNYYEDYRTILKEDGTAQYYSLKYYGWNNWVWRRVYPEKFFDCFSHYPRTTENHKRMVNMTGVLYTKNLKKCLVGTAFQYSGIEQYQKYYYPRMIGVKSYLEAYLKFPQLEYFVKAGLYRLSREVVWNGYSKAFDFNAKRLKETLKVSKENLRILQRNDLGSSYVALFQKMEEHGVRLDEVEKINYPVIYGMNDDLLEKNELASVRKITTYFAKQVEKRYGSPGYRLNSDLSEMSEQEQWKHRNIARDWKDYLHWAETLGHGVTDRAFLFPGDLGKAHDRLEKEYEKYQKKEEKKKLRQTRAATDRILKDEARLLDGKIENEDYILMAPQNWQDLRREGDALGHCVGTYVEHIAKGRCSVYFIRQKSEPEKPFYTVEWRDDRIRQCQGKGRCAPTERVNDFLTYAVNELRYLKTVEKIAA